MEVSFTWRFNLLLSIVMYISKLSAIMEVSVNKRGWIAVKVSKLRFKSRVSYTLHINCNNTYQCTAYHASAMVSTPPMLTVTVTIWNKTARNIAC